MPQNRLYIYYLWKLYKNQLYVRLHGKPKNSPKLKIFEITQNQKFKGIKKRFLFLLFINLSKRKIKLQLNTTQNHLKTILTQIKLIKQEEGIKMEKTRN